VRPATVVIKKYGNRRLYDTAASCYVNLDDLPDSFAKARMFSSGTQKNRTGPNPRHSDFLKTSYAARLRSARARST
jgi:polyhydroxyalkanoate synthesis regulator protein